MEESVSEVLENILSLLGLEGSFDVEEKDEGVFARIETTDPGKLIGRQGETLTAMQLIINLIMLKKLEGTDSKRVILDVASWRKSKEEELAHRARSWAEEVLQSGQELELEPMPAWQRRIIHLTIENTPGVKSESVGEGLDRHLLITADGASSKK